MPHKYLLLVLMLASFFTLAHKNDEHKTIEQAITQSLDQFHHAAAEANASVYLGLLTSDAIFLGTDASERWTKKQFTEFVLPHFNQGNGWLYQVKERNISLIKHSKVAFFDEILENQKYGFCRGSGVLIQTEQGWKISQYNLSFLVPNGVAKTVVEQIKHFKQEP